jgi:transcriptional regulator with XRE-family HTH domain
MSRRPITDAERRHGERVGRLLAERRQTAQRSAAEVARASDVSLDAVRSLEMGRVPTPAFLTVARLAGALGVSLDELHAQASAFPAAAAESG